MLAIRTSQLFNGEHFITGDTTVLIEDGGIAEVAPGHPDVGEATDILEVRDGTVLPGLIDTHVHLVADSSFGALDKVAGFTAEEMDTVMTEALRRQLAAGVTTVRDLGDRHYCAIVRRDSGGSALEPTILGSGPPLTSPGGHCHYMGGEVTDRDSLARMIDERVDRRVDIVKVMASGGMTTPGTDVLRTQFSTDDLRFLVDRSHAAGLPVTAHAHGLPAVLQAIEVGVDGIEHCSCLTETGVEVSDDTVAALVRRGIVVGGALGAPPADAIDRAPQAIKDMMRRMGATPEGVRAIRLAMVGRMHEAGVTLVTGADSGINPFMGHGNLRSAAAFLVEAGGTIAEALAASTSIAARACGLGGRKGSLRKGFDADIVVVDGDLRADLGALGNVAVVLKGGREMAR